MTTFIPAKYQVIKVETPEILEDVRVNSFTFPESDSYLGGYEILQENKDGTREYIGPYRIKADAEEARVGLARGQRLLRDGKHITTGT